MTTNYGDTVGILLACNFIVPPQNWLHSLEIENDNGVSLQYLLTDQKYVYLNNKFVLNCKSCRMMGLC